MNEEEIEIGIVSVVPKNDYDPTVTYERLNVVTYQGSSYIAKSTNTNVLPTNTDVWQLLSQKGATGAAGYTPVKGTDYFTEEDIDDVVEELLNSETVQTMQSDISNKLNSSLKGANNGLAELDGTGKVPSSQLPSYVDDVLEYNNKSAFPATGESGKIYVAKDTNLTYRWSGTAYVEISESLALGETPSTAYRGDRGKIAYEHASDNNKVSEAKAKKFYKVGVTAKGHISAVEEVTKSDLTGLGVEDASNKSQTLDENSTNDQYPTSKIVYDNLLGLDTRLSLVEGRSTNLTWKQISDIVKAGQAEKYFKIGDQIITTWKDTQTNTEYEVALDVVAFRNVTIEENEVEKSVPRNDFTMALLYTFWSTI